MTTPKPLAPEEREHIQQAARETASRLVAERGPIPDQLLQDIGRRLRNAAAAQDQAEQRPA